MLGQWLTGAVEPSVQEELRSPGEAAGTGHRGAGFPKSQQGSACPRGLLLLFSPGNCYGASHLWLPPSLISGFSSSQIPACSSTSLLSWALLSFLPKQTWRGHTAFLPHCACCWLFCCSFRICPRLLPHCGGRTASLGEWQSPVVLGPGTLQGPCAHLGSVWHGWKQRMCWDEEDAEGRAAG